MPDLLGSAHHQWQAAHHQRQTSQASWRVCWHQSTPAARPAHLPELPVNTDWICIAKTPQLLHHPVCELHPCDSDVSGASALTSLT